MPLKVVLVQVTDLDKYYDVVHRYSGLATADSVSMIDKRELIRSLETSKKPIIAPYPMGILALAAFAREHFGDKVEFAIIDMLQQRLRIASLMERIEKFSPDVIGLSTFSSFSMALHEIASAIKGRDPACKVIAGGPYCSAAVKRAASDTNIDCVVYGEGELTFVEIIERLLKGKEVRGIRGTAYRQGGSVVVEESGRFIEDIDSLPFPAVDLIDVGGYFGNVSVLGYAAPWMILFNSRGCPYRCIYCHNIFGKRPRFMSVDRTFKEIMFYYKRYGIREFQVWDDIFNLDVDRGVELCRKIAREGVDFRFLFQGGLRADIMKKRLLKEMIKAGTCYICYAVETASPRLQKIIKKNLDLRKAAQAINYTAGAGVLVNTYNMLGLPGETREEMMQTINYNIGLKHFSVRLFKAIPQEGTEFFDMVYPAGAPSGETDMYIEYSGRSAGGGDAEFKALVADAWRRFYLDPERVERILKMKVPTMSRSELMRAYAAELMQILIALGIKDISNIPPEVKDNIQKVFTDASFDRSAGMNL